MKFREWCKAFFEKPQCAFEFEGLTPRLTDEELRRRVLDYLERKEMDQPERCKHTADMFGGER